MVAKNDITGNEIRSRILSKEGRDNFDKIFKKDNIQNMSNDYKRCLFLDDVREPNEAFLWGENKGLIAKSGISAWKWDIVRSYEDFVKYIDTHGIPDVVSFDNDLWDVAYELAVNPTSEQLAKQFQMIGWQDFEHKTGAHCAQYLVGACKAHGKDIPKYYIHTANSAARPIIREILENARNS
jgi:hypothetical protein